SNRPALRSSVLSVQGSTAAGLRRIRDLRLPWIPAVRRNMFSMSCQPTHPDSIAVAPALRDMPGTTTPVTLTPDVDRQLAQLDERVRYLVAQHRGESEKSTTRRPEVNRIWGVPFARLSLESTLTYVGQLIAEGKPRYFITANVNYAMLTREHPE